MSKANVEEKLRIVLNNVAEPIEEFAITVDDIRKLLESREHPISYIGYEPSGPIHIGYLPGIEKLIELSRIGFKTKILLADLHAYLNKKGPLDIIRDASLTYWTEIFKALGAGSAEYVLGSDMELTREYIEDLFTLSIRISVHEAWRAMAIIAREAENPVVGQYVYPIMQILDILYLDVDLAIGGTDQRKIHVLAREEFSKKELKLHCKVKVPSSIHLPILIGLTGEKMSSSKPKTHIAVHERPETISRKIRTAYCPRDNTKPEENPIFGILRYIIFPYAGEIYIKREEKYGGDIKYTNYNELERDYLNGKLHPQDLKNAVAEFLIERLKRARNRIEEDPDILKSLARLQKWQWEHGFLDKAGWEAIKKEYGYYGIKV